MLYDGLMGEKAIGYMFMIIGVGVIGLAGYSVYSVFTGSITAFPLFNFSGVTVPASSLLGAEFANASIPDIEIFPAEILNGTTNILAHLFLMSFIVTVGYKIAMLGVNLVRPVIVKVEGAKIPSILDPKAK